MKINTLKNHLEQVTAVLERNSLEQHDPILKHNDPEAIKQLLNTNLPDKHEAFDHILRDFEREILPSLNQNASPNFGAYITGSGNKIGALAEFIKAWYNQNGLKWNNSPIASELEQLVIKWIAEYCLLPNHSRGVLTSGGSMSNLLAIHFALADRYPEREMKGFSNAPSFTIYCSNQTHSSVDRAMVFLGLGREQLRKVDVNEHFQIDLKQLRQTIEKDLREGHTPFMLIGNAGTTNTGTIDDLDQLSEIAKKYNLWYHVDGAYGLPARRLPKLTEAFEGIEHADSVIINPHKWMYVPFEASCVLLKEIPEAIHFTPDYLFTDKPGARWESSNHTIELSKEFRALKIWFTMKYYGTEQLTQFVQHDIDMIRYFAEQLEKVPNVEIEPNYPLSILCFRYRDPAKSDDDNEQVNIQAIRKIETEGKIFITGTKLHGKTFLRVYYGNPERTKEDVAYMAKVIRDTFN
ncbi:MAG: aminotransferase class I/II-fold pyridoxal phosphate-dependent enzyme [Ekhidna sp.]